MAGDTRKGAKKPAQASAGRGRTKSKKKPPAVSRPLNARQHLFALIYSAGNVTQGEAYVRAGFCASGHAAEVCAGKLLKNAEVKSIVDGIRAKAAEKAEEEAYVNLDETRRMLAMVIRTPIGKIDEMSPVCAELQRTRRTEGRGEDAEEWETEKIKKPCILRAMELNGKLAGWLNEKGDAPPPPLKPAEEEIAHGRAVLERAGYGFAPRDVRGTEAG